MSFLSFIAGRRHAAMPAADGAAFVSVSRSHVGKVRVLNEDRVLERADFGLWAVADGMGGHSAGDVAAERIVAALEALGTPSADTVEAALAGADAGLRRDCAAGGPVSGATAVTLLCARERATVFWVGDCRAYRWRRGRLEQLTTDHSVVQEMIDAGVLTPEQAAGHPQSHVVTRALGAGEPAAIDRISFAIEPGDRYLLCSDGLSRSAGDIAAILRRDADPDATVDALLDAALDGGGRDNISLVLIVAQG